MQPHPNDPTSFLNVGSVPPGQAVAGGEVVPSTAVQGAGFIPCNFDEDDNQSIPLPGSMLLSGEEERVAAMNEPSAATATMSKALNAALAHQPSRQQRPIGETKPPISHSTVEKQRRDRINSLIDELRELVPPSQQLDKETIHNNGTTSLASNSQSLSESRRPKHAVLTDTIALVRDLRSQLAAVQIEMTQAQQAQQQGVTDIDNDNGPPGNSSSPPSDLQGSGPAAVAAAAAAAAVSAAAAAVSPSFASAPGLEGVEIAPGEGCMYVKVHCKDRHGLLSDIVRTLKAIPLEIKTAAITTTAAGNVYDVFQVVPAPGTPRATAEHIRDSVVAAMSSSTEPNGRETMSEKKRRAR